MPKQSDVQFYTDSGVANPLQFISNEHALLLDLCNLLEALADSLPHDLDRNSVQIAVSILRNSWPHHVAIEEKFLILLMPRHSDSEGRLRAVLQRLQLEHSDDEDRAAEIVGALDAYLDTGKLRNPESLGYMLRAFFESQRRRIGWEEDVLLPMFREALNPTDISS